MAVCGISLSRSLLEAKRTCPFALHMSAYDPKRIMTGLNDFGLNSHPALYSVLV